jgi:hypothetical protein
MSEHLLKGLDGSNPLAFLAALGTLRSVTLAIPRQRVRLRWQADEVWHPVLMCDQDLSAEQLVSVLATELSTMEGHLALQVDDNLKMSPLKFHKYAQAAVAQGHETRDWRQADFAAAFGSEAVFDAELDTISDTALRTMSGAGHQHFLKTMRDIVADTTPEQLAEALFGPWRYRDLKLSLRWDPFDDRRYALRWKEPSGDPAMTVRGANRLAIEGVPLFPCMPVGSRLETTGFRGIGARDTFWTWPIWTAPIEIDVVRPLLALGALQVDEGKIDRAYLSARGIAEVFRSQRLTIGKFRNFTPARSV